MPSNVLGLRNYLLSVGIDVSKISDEGWDETGYNEIVTDHTGRTLYTGNFQLQFTRKEWPSPTVYKNVVILIGGGDERDLYPEPTPKPAETKPTAAKPKAAPAKKEVPKEKPNE